MFFNQSCLFACPRRLMLCGVMLAAAVMPAPGHATVAPSASALPQWGSLPDFLARVVYFREESNDAGGDGEADAATRIYINGRLHAAVAAGRASVFCLPYGAYVLLSLNNPELALTPQAAASQVLEGGATYYFKVAADQPSNSQAGAVPLASDASQAAAALARSAGEGAVLSRAEMVVACPST